MTKETESGEDMLSALMDGQLRGQDFARTLERIGHDENARLTWHAYHLVGDVLRSGDLIVRAHDADFLQRLRVRMEQDVPLALHADAVDPMPGVEIANRAANDSSRWKFVAGLASLMAVAVIGWQLVGGLTDARDMQQVMFRDPQLDALLAAHRQSGGTPPLQMSAGFLRNATFEGTNR
jgi:sigma-E factor negative regulatory protein RseA